MLELSPPLPSLQTGQSSCGSQILRSCHRGHCAPSKRATGLQSKQVKLRRRSFFSQLANLPPSHCASAAAATVRWCSHGHCCPYKQDKGVAMGMARAWGMIWLQWRRSCLWLCWCLVMLAVYCYGLCLVRNSKINLTFFSTEKTY